MTPDTYIAWLAHLRSVGPRMKSSEMEACARLAIVLLQGEQSAIQVFAAEIERNRAPANAITALRSIEYDEKLHEMALRAFCDFLPNPDDAHALKRRAQHFFARLGRNTDMARHFGQIANLDSAVCSIMRHIEESAINCDSPLRWMAMQIKNDEARHVSVSRRYASLIGLPANVRDDDGIIIRAGLVKMLAPLSDSFEIIGVDSDRLYRRISKQPLS